MLVSGTGQSLLLWKQCHADLGFLQNQVMITSTIYWLWEQPALASSTERFKSR